MRLVKGCTTRQKTGVRLGVEKEQERKKLQRESAHQKLINLAGKTKKEERRGSLNPLGVKETQVYGHPDHTHFPRPGRERGLRKAKRRMVKKRGTPQRGATSIITKSSVG